MGGLVCGLLLMEPNLTVLSSSDSLSDEELFFLSSTEVSDCSLVSSVEVSEAEVDDTEVVDLLLVVDLEVVDSVLLGLVLDVDFVESILFAFFSSFFLSFFCLMVFDSLLACVTAGEISRTTEVALGWFLTTPVFLSSLAPTAAAADFIWPH